MDSDNKSDVAHENISDEQLRHRLESLQQENVVLKAEIETFKIKIKSLQEENLELRKNSVNIQVRAEQEEEYISNKLLKKITELKREKESLALNYEQEEEFLTNDLTRKLSQLREEKANLEKTLEKEQEAQISKLMSHIQKLESEVMLKQKTLDTLRHEKIELENALEQEQEGLVNKLWKKLEKLESEKRMLQSKLDLSPSPAFSDTSKCNEDMGSRGFLSINPNNDNDVNIIEEDVHNSRCSEQEIDTVLSSMEVEGDHTSLVHTYIGHLRQEVTKLREMVHNANNQCSGKLQTLEREEKILQDENKRLRKRLQAEIERRQEICRNLSESESSLEIDEERQFNETCRRRGNLNELTTKNRIRTASDCSNLSITGTRSLHCSVDYSHMKFGPVILRDDKSCASSQPCDRRSVSSNRSQISLKNNVSPEVAACDSMDQTFSEDQSVDRDDHAMVTHEDTPAK